MAESSRASSRRFTEVVSNPRKSSKTKGTQKDKLDCEDSKYENEDEKINLSKSVGAHADEKVIICSVDPDTEIAQNENSKQEVNQEDEVQDDKKKEDNLKKRKPALNNKIKKNHLEANSKSLANKNKEKSVSLPPTGKSKQLDKKRAINQAKEVKSKAGSVITRNQKKSDSNYNSDVVVVEKSKPKIEKEKQKSRQKAEKDKSKPKAGKVKQIRKISKEKKVSAEKPDKKVIARKGNAKNLIIETERLPSVDKKTGRPNKKTKVE